MPTAPDIRVVKIEFGPLPQGRALNPRFSPGRPLLWSILDIRWTPDDPAAAIARIEETLLAFRPDFSRHECRGAERYHVFARTRPRPPAPPPGDPLDGPLPGDQVAARPSDPYEGALALAHLIEHAVIDFQCDILRERRCSGITAARRTPPGRFDLMVESPDPHVGRCCLALAVTWLSSAAQGQPLGAAEREILAAARLAHDRVGEALRPPLVAGLLAWSEQKAGRALAALTDVGYLVETHYTMNLSGVPEYRLSGA